MSNFLLVHGGLHGGWCWDRVVPLLQARGHEVRALDLPGSDRRTPAAEVTFDTYRDATVAAVMQAAEPPILVGHSLGGRTISIAAETAPDRIRALVYLAAILPALDRGKNPQPDPDNIIAKAFFPADDGLSLMVPYEAARAGFYSDCSEEDAKAAFSRVVPQPTLAVTTPVCLTAANWGRVPRHYIYTTKDLTVPIAMQRAMVELSPCASTHEIPSGHSPFLNHPGMVADILCEIARTPATV